MRNQQLILKNSNLGFLGKNKKLRNELLELQEKLKKNRLEIDLTLFRIDSAVNAFNYLVGGR